MQTGKYGNENYGETLSLLNKHFETERNLTYERLQFRSRMHEESAVTYINALKNLARARGSSIPTY